MGSELRSRMLELIETRKQRELTLEEKKEATRLFKKAVLEPDTQPLKTHTGENEFTRAEKTVMRRRYEQHVPDSPSKTRMLRMWELADINTYERKLTAEERAELLKLIMQPILRQHPELAALEGESDKDRIAGS
jgi:pyruvate/2-oxoglutarate dehydrogenase complex dihydrolipoamide acyltransferase (E2) component